MDPFAPTPPARSEPDVLLLRALAWVCADDDRASRLLGLTGLDAAALRSRATEPAILAATGDFLAAHEVDLIACASGIGATPAQIVAATQALSA